MVQVLTQLGQEETICVAIGLAHIDCIHQLACTAQSCDDVNPIQPASSGHLVLLRSVNPSTLPMVSIPEH